MTEENNKEFWSAIPEGEEPEEIVSWYMPPEDGEEPKESIAGHVPVEEGMERADLPGKFDNLRPMESRQTVEEWREVARRDKKRRRRIRLGVLTACLLVVAGLAFLWSNSADRGREQGKVKPSDGDSASSILDVTDHDKITIPRFKGKDPVRLAIHPQRGEELTAVEIYRKTNPAVVTVVAETLDGSSVGTGVIMTPDGYIVTNAHVISGGRGCWIALDSGVTLDAMLVGYDKDEDLAVLKAIKASDLPVAEFGDSETLEVGERVYAIGNPLGIELRGTLTDGIVSAVNRQVEVGDGHMTMIQTTAALNNGNSGGPLINSSGQIVGINTLKMGGSGGKGEATVEGLGFALPIHAVSFVVNDLIANGEFRGVPTIGITVITVQNEEGDTQVQVFSVEEGMGAAAAGVRENDIILAADGVPIYQIGDLQAVRRNHNVGETIKLTLLRDGETLELDVVLHSNKKP